MSTNSVPSKILAMATLGSLALAAQYCRADDYFSPTDERVRISMGAMYVSSATDIRADSSTGASGTDINAEDTLRLSKWNFEPKFEAMVRVDTRHRLSFDYFTLDRSGSATLTGNPLYFRDVKLLPGDPLETQLSLRMLGVTYGYSFWHTETLEIAGTLGVHATDVSATAKVETQTRHIIQTEDQAGPVPMLGIDATWVASNRFYLDGRVQYLDVKLRNFSGSLGRYEFDALYRYRPNVSFGVGYAEVTVHLTSTQTSQTGFFGFATKGPEMFFRIAF